MTMANIPKAAMRATNNVMRGYIPHNGIVSAGAKIVAKNQSGSRSAGKKKRHTRLTEISRGSGKAIISDGVTVNQAIKKLAFMELETGRRRKGNACNVSGRTVSPVRSHEELQEQF